MASKSKTASAYWLPNRQTILYVHCVWHSTAQYGARTLHPAHRLGLPRRPLLHGDGNGLGGGGERGGGDLRGGLLGAREGGMCISRQGVC